MSFEDDIYDYAKAQGYTSAQVADAERDAIIEAAGYTYATVPKVVFKWQQFQRAVVQRLKQDEIDAADTTTRAAIKAKVQELASHPNVDVEVVRNGGGVSVEGPALIIRKVVS